MIEGPPHIPDPEDDQNEEETVENAEIRPHTYEEVLSAAQELKAQGIKSPEDTGDPAIQLFWDKAEVWYAGFGIPPNGIETAEQAQNFIRYARLLVDAGFTNKQKIREAIDLILPEIQLSEKKGKYR